jgi:hypothetical protein
MEATGKLVDRSRQYHNVDGVGELGIGVMCLGYALLGWMQVHSPEHSAWNGMFTLFIFVGVLCAVIHYGTRAIKQRITFPRTGYVEYRKRDKVWIPMLVGAFVSAMFAAAAVIGMRSHWNLTSAASLTGVLFAGFYARGIARSVQWKWIVVVLLAATSLVVGLLPASALDALIGNSWVSRRHHLLSQAFAAVWLCMTAYGVLTLISGGISLWLYLRRTQPPAPEQE